MRRPLTALVLALAALLGGCAGGARRHAAGGDAAGMARPADCPLEILYKAPDRPYQPLGDLLIQVTSPPPGGAVEALRPKACALGADAVIVTRSQVLNLFDHTLVEGTAIRFTLAPPPSPAAQ